MKEVLMPSPNALADIPIDLSEMMEDAKLGGTLSLADISIPYLYILQGLSPQVNPDHDKYIEGAKPGMLYLTGLEIVCDGRDEGIQVVPCYYERLITEWLPRETGGGLVASHDPSSEILNDVKQQADGKSFLPNGHQVIETAYHYMLAKNPKSGVWHQAIAPFKSTALKASRRMNSTISTTMIPGTDKRAPRFLYMWQLKTVKEQKDQYIWSSPRLTQLDMVSADIYAAAKQYAVVAAKGLLRRAAIESEHLDPSKAPLDSRELDDEVPF